MLTFTIPIRAPSTPNLREHWAQRAKRTDSQKRAARAACPVWSQGPLLVVRLTRVAPRALDGDNLQGALKAVRDGLALWLRVDDASPLVRWEYGQTKGEPRVEVEVLTQRDQSLPIPKWPEPFPSLGGTPEAQKLFIDSVNKRVERMMERISRKVR